MADAAAVADAAAALGSGGDNHMAGNSDYGVGVSATADHSVANGIDVTVAADYSAADSVGVSSVFCF